MFLSERVGKNIGKRKNERPYGHRAKQLEGITLDVNAHRTEPENMNHNLSERFTDGHRPQKRKMSQMWMFDVNLYR